MFWRIFLIILSSPCIAGYPRRSDLAIILDVSKSISRGAFLDTLDFIERILYRKSISPGTTRVGLITFTSKAHLQFSFEKYVNREGLLKRLDSFRKRPLRGKTNLNSALEKAVYLFDNYKGFAKEKEVYIFSDGKWNDGNAPSRKLHSLWRIGVKIFAFGIGKRPEMLELERLANCPIETHVFMLNRGSRVEQKILQLLTENKAYGLCSATGKNVTDECSRQCKCIDGVLTDCYRIRREFTSLSLPDRKKYIKAYLKLTTREPIKSRFKPFIYKHAYYFWKGIHNKEHFFPWHRWYIYEFENLMKEIDCTITVPFWDWSFYSDVAFEKGKRIWREDEYGLGGNGDLQDSFCVKSGVFRDGSWKPPGKTVPNHEVSATFRVLTLCKDYTQSFYTTAKHRRCLRRAFNHTPKNVSHVLNTLSLPCSKYDIFEWRVRKIYHNDVHNYVGGTMCSDYAGNAPEFFLHHGFLDNIWYRWQQRFPGCANNYLRSHITELHGSKYRSNRFIESNDQGESVKVKYEDFLTGRLDPKVYELDLKLEETMKEPRYSTCKDPPGKVCVAPFSRSSDEY